MRIGLVITVKNEARLLRKNILYHHYLGVDTFFIYLDNTTDGSREAIKDLPYISVQPSVSAKKYGYLNNIGRILDNYEENFVARQGLNSIDAIHQGNEKGLDWIISLDADELICPNPDKAHEGQLKNFFKEISPETDQVIFSTLEAVQRQKRYENVLAEETLFKTRARFKSSLDQVRKRIYDPRTDQYKEISYWYGQSMGKCAVRPNNGIRPNTSHRFVNNDTTKMQTVRRGHVLHFYAYDADDFIKKFLNFIDHPSTYLMGGQIEYRKLLWRDVVNHQNYSEAQLEDYFEKWLMFSKEEINAARAIKHPGNINRKQPAFIKVSGPQQVFTQLKQNGISQNTK